MEDAAGRGGRGPDSSSDAVGATFSSLDLSKSGLETMEGTAPLAICLYSWGRVPREMEKEREMELIGKSDELGSPPSSSPTS